MRRPMEGELRCLLLLPHQYRTAIIEISSRNCYLREYATVYMMALDSNPYNISSFHPFVLCRPPLQHCEDDSFLVPFLFFTLNSSSPSLARSTTSVARQSFVTGANTSLSFKAAKHFIRLNTSEVILAVRTLSKGEAAKSSIQSSNSLSKLLSKFGILIFHPTSP